MNVFSISAGTTGFFRKTTATRVIQNLVPKRSHRSMFESGRFLAENGCQNKEMSFFWPTKWRCFVKCVPALLVWLKKEGQEAQLSNEKNLGWLGYIGDYTIQLYRDYNKP